MVGGKFGERGIDLVVGRKYKRENGGHFREIYRERGVFLRSKLEE